MDRNNEEIVENGAGWTCSMHGGDVKCIQNFNRKI
jgi:hypothetical protein